MLKKSRQTINKRVFLALLVIVIVFVGLITLKLAVFVRPLYQLTFKKEIELKKTPEQRINILLLGIGGGVHEGPLLTDTIIFASIDPEKKQATLISIPRDLWIPSMQAKINTVYAFSEEKQKGSGLQKTKEIVEEILGQKADYGFRIDFNGFIKAVDMVGGLEIDVDHAFDDYEYPIDGKEQDDCGFTGDDFLKRATEEAQLQAFPCRYEHLHFDKGLQHMDGEIALKFVRSRHALGTEGSDFSRSRRQEKIIHAFKDKVLSLQIFLNPIKLVGLYDIFKGSIDTDIKQEEYGDFIKLAQKMREAKIESGVLDVGNDATNTPGLLINPPVAEEFKYQWVIVPRAGSNNYSEIHTYTTCIIRGGENCLH